jgi:glycosyltransferase involved in cell wall biosynthesis
MNPAISRRYAPDLNSAFRPDQPDCPKLRQIGHIESFEAREQRNPTLCCIVPCLNEAENLDRLVPQIVDALGRISENWQLILVDDGSTDESVVVMSRWTEISRVTVLQLSRNFGKEAAITAGLEHANADAVIIMDGDGQHPPALLAQMVQCWREGADIAVARGKPRDKNSLWRRLPATAFYALLNLASPAPICSGAGDFRLLDRAAVVALLQLPERTRFMKGLYSWVGFETRFIDFIPAPRANGKSRFNLMALLRLSLDGIASFTSAPLYAIGVIGVSLSILSIGYGLVITMQYLFSGNTVSGWTTLAVVLFLSTGLQLVGLGVLGIYLAKVFDEVKQRPLYIVSKRIKSNTVGAALSRGQSQ